MIAEVVRLLPPLLEIWIGFLAPGFNLAQSQLSQALKGMNQHIGDLYLSSLSPSHLNNNVNKIYTPLLKMGAHLHRNGQLSSEEN